MASSNMKNPPIFKENEMDYEEWKKDIGLWTLLTDLPKAKMAIAIHLFEWSCSQGLFRINSK